MSKLKNKNILSFLLCFILLYYLFQFNYQQPQWNMKASTTLVLATLTTVYFRTAASLSSSASSCKYVVYGGSAQPLDVCIGEGSTDTSEVCFFFTCTHSEFKSEYFKNWTGQWGQTIRQQSHRRPRERQLQLQLLWNVYKVLLWRWLAHA